ncbi:MULTISPECIES: phage tail assembly chaperone [unclassified Massilia]|uniref:phage tail assembly chaperone n=1 Tax=unclassified Massilia TaxID=2609279 RepID=UPI00177E9AAE|nr:MULTISPECIES: phage tail assembly chaperone [unclassified Massilia]MBD8531576.1 hypothetical protein [Massilia sp. CFBP 13647]MBD8673628.1 hypothetical protein [Massilia sp. CFBP 13721]
MAKIILGKPPTSFVRTVKFLQVDGEPGQIGVTYKYRDRTDFGKFTDGIVAEIQAEDAAEMDKLKKLAEGNAPIPQLTESDILARQDETSVRYIMGCVEGWDLDMPFDKAAVVQLVAEVPAAIPAIVATYRDAITEGRQGN